MRPVLSASLAAVALCVALLPAPAAAQSGLEEVFGNVFNELLNRRLNRQGSGDHGDHYLPAAGIAQDKLVPALSSFISTNVSNFPSSSTQLGVILDFSTGQPVSRIDRLGPIYAETAGTIGQRRMAVGGSVSFLTLDKIRGENLDDVEFRFLHQDIEPNGTGDPVYERDVLVVQPRLDLNATIFGLHASYGLTPALDVGVAIPIVNLEARGNALGRVDTTRFPFHFHNYGGTVVDPDLETEYEYSRSEMTVPNVALRVKYRIPVEGVALALFGEVLVPVAGEESLLGEQKAGGRLMLVGSRSYGRVNPHVNVGYEVRGSGTDQMVFTAGFDANLVPRVNVAAGLVGRYDVGGEPTRFYDADAQAGLPGSREQIYFGENRQPVVVPFSNVPKHTTSSLTGTIGSRFLLTRWAQGFVNLLVPFTPSGLQSSFVPSVGFSVYL